MCKRSKQVAGFMAGIRWIDDVFLNDEKIEFDYEAFDIIDSGAEYINPKHFSAKELIRAVTRE